MSGSPFSEAQIEAQVTDLFIRAGWYPLKTDAAQVVRGSGRGRVQRGTLPLGFPDRVYLLGWPEFSPGFCWAVLVELKTAIGQLRASQIACHIELIELYGLRVYIVRSPEEAQVIIAEVRDMKARYSAWVKANS